MNKFTELEPILVKALGKRKAKRVLGKVQHMQPFDNSRCLKQAFIWDESPQGHKFWSNIYTDIQIASSKEIK
jgi:hypothetical protein